MMLKKSLSFALVLLIGLSLGWFGSNFKRYSTSQGEFYSMEFLIQAFANYASQHEGFLPSSKEEFLSSEFFSLEKTEKYYKCSYKSVFNPDVKYEQIIKQELIDNLNIKWGCNLNDYSTGGDFIVDKKEGQETFIIVIPDESYLNMKIYKNLNKQLIGYFQSNKMHLQKTKNG